MEYAIVEDGGKQYKVVEGGSLEVDRFPAEIGEYRDPCRDLALCQRNAPRRRILR